MLNSPVVERSFVLNINVEFLEKYLIITKMFKFYSHFCGVYNFIREELTPICENCINFDGASLTSTYILHIDV